MWKSFVFMLLLLVFLCPLQAVGAKKSVSPVGKTSGYSKAVFKGEVLSREIAKTTGIALNPLLCMSALGAYTYYTTEHSLRSQLPWHASPRFWGSLGMVMLLILLKDSSKIAIPKVLIAPLDAMETLLEKKATALLALPMLFSAIQSGEFTGMEQVSAQLGMFLFPQAIAGTAGDAAVMAGGGMVTDITTFAMVSTIFVVVWVLSHAFNMLILLSPFGFFDAILATTRNTLVAIVMGMADTSFGLGLSVVIIAVAVWFFPRALRLIIFGTVLSYDLVRYRLFRKIMVLHEGYQGVRGFSCCHMGKIPPRTYGRISHDKGQLVFTCKPGILQESQRLLTGISPAECELVPGILSPVVQRSGLHIFRIRPAYYKVIEQVGTALGVKVARETSLAGKARACLKWVAALLKKTPRLEVPLYS
jgi:hypothetical protein